MQSASSKGFACFKNLIFFYTKMFSLLMCLNNLRYCSQASWQAGKQAHKRIILVLVLSIAVKGFVYSCTAIITKTTTTTVFYYYHYYCYYYWQEKLKYQQPICLTQIQKANKNDPKMKKQNKSNGQANCFLLTHSLYH